MENGNYTPWTVKLVGFAMAIIAFVPVSMIVLTRAAQIVA